MAAREYTLEELRKDPVGEETWVERPDGTRLRVRVAGSGPTVFLAHGFGLTMLEWNIVAEMLVAKGYRVITFDQRGHGQSTIGKDGVGSLQMAGDYLAILEQLDIHDAILVGHSMGGFVAIAGLLDVPGLTDRVKAVILFATFSGSITKGSMQNKAQIPMIKSGILKSMLSSGLVAKAFSKSIYGDNPDPAALSMFVEIFKAQDLKSLVPILKAFGDEDRGDRLSQIKKPTIVICGRKDSTAPPWQSERLSTSIEGATMVWVEGAGHMVNWEAPEALVDAIESLR